MSDADIKKTLGRALSMDEQERKEEAFFEYLYTLELLTHALLNARTEITALKPEDRGQLSRMYKQYFSMAGQCLEQSEHLFETTIVSLPADLESTPRDRNRPPAIDVSSHPPSPNPGTLSSPAVAPVASSPISFSPSAAASRPPQEASLPASSGVAQLTAAQRSVLALPILIANQQNRELLARIERHAGRKKADAHSNMSLQIFRRCAENTALAQQTQQRMLRQMLSGGKAEVTMPIVAPKAHSARMLKDNVTQRLTAVKQTILDRTRSPSGSNAPAFVSQPTKAPETPSASTSQPAVPSTPTTPATPPSTLGDPSCAVPPELPQPVVEEPAYTVSDEEWCKQVALAPSDMDLIHGHLSHVMRNPRHKWGQAVNTFYESFSSKCGVGTGCDEALMVKIVLEFIDKLCISLQADFKPIDTRIGGEQCRLSVEDAVLPRIYHVVFPYYQLRHGERDASLKQKAAQLTLLAPSVFEVRRRFWLAPESVTDATEIDKCVRAGYGQVIQDLQRVSGLRSPFDKLCALVDATQNITSAVQAFHANSGVPSNQLVVGADDLMPLFALCIIKSGAGLWYAEAGYLSDFINENICAAEEGYVLATLQTCLDFIEKVYDDWTNGKKADC